MNRHAKFLLLGLAVWPALAAAAIANGALRDLVLAPLLGAGAAEWAGAATALMLFFTITFAFLAHTRARPAGVDLWILGVLWAGLAAAFEFAFFRFAVGVPADEILRAYDVGAGATWPWVLAGLVVAPRAVAVLARRRAWR